VTAVRSTDGACGEVLRKVFRREILLLLDLKLALEYREVSLRPEHLGASALTRKDVLKLIGAVESYAEAVDVQLKARPQSTDPDDDMVLDLAINGKADVVVPL
jgi:predicted nucleic acid-binding protein